MPRGAPAAISGAIHDAVAPWCITLNILPIRMRSVCDAFAADEAQGKGPE